MFNFTTNLIIHTRIMKLDLFHFGIENIYTETRFNNLIVFLP